MEQAESHRDELAYRFADSIDSRLEECLVSVCISMEDFEEALRAGDGQDASRKNLHFWSSVMKTG
jgi:hypothetical protein